MPRKYVHSVMRRSAKLLPDRPPLLHVTVSYAEANSARSHFLARTENRRRQLTPFDGRPAHPGKDPIPVRPRMKDATERTRTLSPPSSVDRRFKYPKAPSLAKKCSYDAAISAVNFPPFRFFIKEGQLANMIRHFISMTARKGSVFSRGRWK